MKLSTVKDILLPLGVIWTVCPILGLGMVWLASTFGPMSIGIMLFALGVASLIGLLAIKIYEKRKLKS